MNEVSLVMHNTPLKKGYYNFFSQTSIFIRKKKQSPQYRISRFDKERLKLSNKKIVAVGFIGLHEDSIKMVNQVLEQEVFNEEKREELLASDLSSVRRSNFIKMCLHLSIQLSHIMIRNEI